MHAFKEKMAFFTNLRNDVPAVQEKAEKGAKDDEDEEDEEEEEVRVD